MTGIFIDLKTAKKLAEIDKKRKKYVRTIKR